MKVRGVRGATTASANTRDAVLEATADLLDEMIAANGIDPDDVAAIHFTTSPDLNVEFPSVAARERLGWDYVPLINGHEMGRPGALTRCIRILMLWNTGKAQREIRHIYLKEAVALRPDIAATK